MDMRFIKMAALIAVASTAINAGLAIVGRAVSAPPDTFGPYMISSIVFLNIVGVVAAAIVYLILHRFIKDETRANRWFLILSVIALIASFYPDFMLPYSPDPDDIGWTYGIIANLMLMHVVTGAMVMYYFVRSKVTSLSYIQ